MAPGALAVMAFEAHATGRYPITIHSHDGAQDHATLLYVEILPR